MACPLIGVGLEADVQCEEDVDDSSEASGHGGRKNGEGPVGQSRKVSLKGQLIGPSIYPRAAPSLVYNLLA